MKDGDSIKDIVKRFIAIVNHFGILGRKFENDNLIHKILDHSLLSGNLR